MKIKDVDNTTLGNNIRAFCIRNGIRWNEDVEVDVLNSIKSNWPYITISEISESIIFYEKGSSIKKPFSFEVRFFGQLLSDYRNTQRSTGVRYDDSVHQARKYTGAEREATIRKNFPDMVHWWKEMRVNGSAILVSQLLEHYDKLMMDAKVYTLETFSKSQITEAYRSWQDYQRRTDLTFGKNIVNAIHKGAKPITANKHAVGRIGCYFDTLQRNTEPPIEVISLLHQYPNGYL